MKEKRKKFIVLVFNQEVNANRNTTVRQKRKWKSYPHNK